MTRDTNGPNGPMDNFTRAVKTIVNIPKHAHSKGSMQKIQAESSDKYATYVCSQCGQKMIVYKGNTHKKET